MIHELDEDFFNLLDFIIENINNKKKKNIIKAKIRIFEQKARSCIDDYYVQFIEDIKELGDYDK
jgi:hypothetical protein